MKRLVYVLAVLSVSTSAVLAQEIDDIYYNPKKDKKIETRTQPKRSNYIKNFDSVDIDDYNRRGQYYKSQIDTIGEKAENDPDFVYTQKLQKFYNPTIVVDNKAVLQDVLDNSYGNIDIVYNINGLPSFASYYSPYIYHYGWRNPWYWNGGWDPYWDWAWNPIYGPSWNWGWGPSWSWGPSWNWGWGPSWSWGWGPSWSGGWSHNHHANYRPTGRYPNRPSANWADNTQPGYTTNNRRPSYGIQGNNTFQTGSSVNHKRGYSDYNSNSSSGSYRINPEQTSSSSSKKGYTINSNGHRTYNSNSQENSTSSNRRYTTTENNSSKNSYNFNSTNNRNSSFSNGSFNRGGGYSSGGGGSRGRHR